MLQILIWATAALCGGALIVAWRKYGDVFHPVVLTSPMFAFMYVYMPLRLLEDDALYSFLTTEQAVFYQSIVFAALAAFCIGCFGGSSTSPKVSWEESRYLYDGQALQRSAYVLGAIGFLAWMYTIQNVGGITNAFGRVKGMGWSDYGYIREAAYFLIVGLLLLLSREAFEPTNPRWRLAVFLFAAPHLLQGLLGAQRGPTFLAIVSLGTSWYLARRLRPSLLAVLGGGATLLMLLLLLVTNRNAIYLGTDQEIETDVSGFFSANEANEYIFGAGCTVTSYHTERFFWGRRYLAQLVVRPIPRQIWPSKYVDFGVPEIEQNAGVAGLGLQAMMGWREVQGAAAGMVADVWVELSWLSLPFLGTVGWAYGYVWKRALWTGGPWVTLFTICLLLSVYFVSQSGEAVIFRLVILSVPSYLAWTRARMAPVEMTVPVTA